MTAPRRLAPKHLAMMAGMNLVWGSMFMFAKFGTDQIPPLMFAALRAAVVAVLLLPWLKPTPGRAGAVTLIAMSMGFIATALFYIGLFYAGNISSVAIAIQTGPPLTVVMAVLFLGERVSAARALAIALAFAGVVVLGWAQTAVVHLVGVVLVVGSALFYAVGTLIMRRLIGVGTLQLQAWVAVLSAPALFAVSAVIEQDQAARLAAADWLALGSLLATALGGSVIGLGGMYYLVQRYPVSSVSPLTLAAPVIGVAIGVLALGDALTLRLMVGGAMTIGGAALVQLSGGRRTVAQTVPP